MSSIDTVNRICSLMISHKPCLVCLVESGVDEARVNQFCDKFKKSWEWAAIATDRYLDKIIALWNMTLGSITLIVKSEYAFHMVINSPSRDSWLFTTVYNGQGIECEH